MSSKVLVERYAITSVRGIDRVVSEIRGSSQTVVDRKLMDTVSGIIEQIKLGGDSALVQLTNRFDSPAIKTGRGIRVSESEIKRAYSRVSSAQLKALRAGSKQIASLATMQMLRFGERRIKTPLGFDINERYEPFRRIGGYVPGGLAAYPSTVLMICVTAKEAGVKEIVLATPPRKDGSVEEAVLVAADICGATEILKCGGAQAISALAFGTASIKKVDVIAGPGNQYVTEAKRQVAAENAVLIDSLAGPTELLVLADESASPRLVAEDLISQAEHGNKTLIGLVTNSKKLIRDVEPRIIDISRRPRQDQIRSASIFTVRATTKNLMVEFVQRFGPEHLEVMTANPKSYERKLTNAGLVLAGDYTPCSSTDYIAGTNHILPTGGTARTTSGLGVENFLRRITTVKGSKRALGSATKYISTLAYMENLPNHATAAVSRFEPEE